MYKLVATIWDKKGRILSQASNNYAKTHPLQQYFAEKAGQKDRLFLHAEIAALLKCRGKTPYRIFIERYHKDGSAALAKPCPVCEEALKAFGIQVVEYTK